MNQCKEIKVVELGGKVGLKELVAVARYGARVEFSQTYRQRVERSRKLVEEWIDQERVMYGVTTGFGALCIKAISKEQTARLQRNIVLSHSTSVGEPFTLEQARATMFMMLQNIGQGYSGVRLAVLEKLRELLNKNVTPWAPR